MLTLTNAAGRQNWKIKMADNKTEDAKTVLWDTLGKTDPAHTKRFKRAGGFQGTAMKPMWVWRRLTEQFGPCGRGWGMEEPSFQVVPGHNNEVLVFCTVRGWHGTASSPHHVYGVGGDKVVTHIKANEQYKRPERWENDDEAFKKAFTDALMNAFKFVGVGADVHMGMFDDNKYVRQMEQEFAPEPDPPAKAKAPPLQGPIKTRAALRNACGEFVRELHACGDADMLAALITENLALIEQVKTEAPFFWDGDGGDFLGMDKEIKRMEAEVAGAK